MLKSLGELGFEHLKRPFVEFVLQEAIEEETLDNVLESCVQYWLETIRSDEDRESIKTYVRKMEAGYGTDHPPHDARGSTGMDDDHDDDVINEMVDKAEKNLATFSQNTEPGEQTGFVMRSESYDEGSHEADMLDNEDLRKQEEELKKTFQADNEELQTKEQTSNAEGGDSTNSKPEEDMELESTEHSTRSRDTEPENLGMV